MMGLVQFGRKAEKRLHAVSGALNWVGMVFLVVMVLTVTVDVGGHYLFRKQLTGSIDFVELMMVIVVFLGLGYCAAQEGNVRVDVVYARLSKRVQASLDILTFAASTFIFALITWRLAARAWNIIQEPLSGPSTGTLQIPHMPFIWLAVVGSLLLCLELLTNFVRSVARIRQVNQ
jgi:TRAP-type C4-dicarboxylate transport system permease small subunit